jgi:LPXTG-motif cell wall-anchored protein
MQNKSYIKREQNKNMENYMDFNGGGIGVAGDIQSQQQKNMENYMDFNGRNLDGKKSNTAFLIGGGILLLVAIYYFRKK